MTFRPQRNLIEANTWRNLGDLTMRGTLFLVGLAMASAFSGPSLCWSFTSRKGNSFVGCRTRACDRMTSLKMANQLANATVQQAVEMKTAERKEVSPFPRSKVDKEWVNNRYVVSTKIPPTGGTPGVVAKWPANIVQGWTGPVPVLPSDQEVITGDLAEAKKSATVIAMCLLLAQPIASAGYYEVQTVTATQTNGEVCGAIQMALETCRSSELSHVVKVDSIGEFRETTRDTLTRYAKSCNYAKNWESRQCQ